MENRQNVYREFDMLNNDDKALENTEVKTPSPLSSAAGRNSIFFRFYYCFAILLLHYTDLKYYKNLYYITQCYTKILGIQIMRVQLPNIITIMLHLQERK